MVLGRFSNAVDAIDPTLDPTLEAGEDSPVPRLGGFEVMNRTIEISQAALMRHTLAAYPPDLLIDVPRTVCRSLEFYRAAEVIEVGNELACAALDSLGLKA
jgi:NTE family protein